MIEAISGRVDAPCFIKVAQNQKIVDKKVLLMAGFEPGLLAVPEIETMSKWFNRTICMGLLLL